ncbi:CoA ester lyase [Halorubrum sp. Atlit-8R]|uniref:HpcH/HpaI aldolase/citrate lyase family protein n=1 Tax=unclassified Halorubrum TaxID=2642239 RepID=UPI000EF24B82|nr:MULTISPECIES: CoA ester lyase [unclassified Halorubrum]RLM70966.1 CoA ester lyase [Halorubrum sp. Atlit-9R]RLM71834.1 CoA ester lyase [Halorubrum sp. Atlit-9R]RLM82881.1 CoA ester lyase [Halorubrum sp. Atlit-8R]
MARRSLLFSPGDSPDLMRKAPGAGADVICFDLEDAVAPGRKDEARAAVREVLSDPDFDPDAEVCVRLTAESPAADLDGVLDGGDPSNESVRLDAVMLPKVEAADRVERVAALCAERGRDPAVFALVETAAGVLSAQSIAAADATDALVFGAEDLAADVGATRTDEGTEVLYAREHVVLAASAAGVDALDTVFTDFSDEAGLREDAAFARRLGYDGKLAIHPAQVGPITEAFTPDPEDVEWAERVLDARDEAERAGKAVFQVDGEMIDAPLIAQAERILDRAPDADR